jgi:hypothetical protein
MAPQPAELALGVLAVLVIALGAAAAIALLTAAPSRPGPVISLTDINDVIAGAIRITREAAQ